MNAPWLQVYDPLQHPLLSTVVATMPVVVLLGCIAVLRLRIHVAALLGLGLALVIACLVYRMPARLAGAATLYGVAFGLFPIGWIILNVIFLYRLSVKRGLFDSLRDSVALLTPDPRVQVVLIAFSFGAFIEGVAGFGAPVAITGAILIQLGFKPLHASGLALIANTAPVAFGSLGIPITTLEQVTGLDALKVSAMVGRQLPLFSVLVPFWVVGAFSGWRGIRDVWPAALVAGVFFAVPQFLISNFHGPWLVDVISGASSLLALVFLLRLWQPRRSMSAAPSVQEQAQTKLRLSRVQVLHAWSPWLILTAFILVWGLPQTKGRLDRLAAPKIEIPFLHNGVQRVPPVALASAKPEPAEYKLNFLSATGTGIFLAALVAGLAMGFPLGELARVYLSSIWHIRLSLLTIMAMLALGTVTRYSGTDATLGLALSQTGVLYPFFGTVLGWLGVALTGSDTASNVLFGSLQRLTAERAGLSPILMAAANSSGGVMGKMVDAQSIVVASTATNWFGHEGEILRYVFFHSVALASLMGLMVSAQAYLFPFTRLVVPG